MSVNHGANLYDLSSKYGFSKDEFMDFSSNINPFGTSNKAKEYVINNINMVSMYPDPEYVNLKKSISTYCHCLEENIVLGSGATELISSFIKTIKPNKTLLLSPAYSEYEKELNKINSEVVKYFSKEENNFVIDEKELVNSINEGNYDLTIICNPNNPTGFAFSREQVEYILKNTTCYVMIDETYIEFTETNIYSSTKLVDEYNKLFVIRGTSKFFSTPGIRLGYGLIGDKNVKEAINKNLDLWNINIIASAMGEIMFLDDMFISNTIDAMLRERDYLTKALSSIDDLTVYPSKGNFILCKINSKKLTAGELREKLLPKKIIIRDCNSFDGLTEYYFRVCILKPEENRLLIKNLNSIFK
ncbi:MAG: pyridoxal phosphate-dependent aminotransferase [Intestinibacter sp.]|uniref:pyridoxal phosphate-dependent aminotransferase n=1 Tax=Intestinibacter sp. TaxID=1965304 RepID=UPI003F15E060